MKHLTPALLQWVANGDQGQNIRKMVFPLNTSRSFFIVSWRTTNHFVQSQRSMVSLLKRSVASSSILLSSRDSTKPHGPQAGLRPSVQHVIEKGRNSDRFHAVSSKVRTGISRVSLTPFFNGGLYLQCRDVAYLLPSAQRCSAGSSWRLPSRSGLAATAMILRIQELSAFYHQHTPNLDRTGRNGTTA